MVKHHGGHVVAVDPTGDLALAVAGCGGGPAHSASPKQAPPRTALSTKAAKSAVLTALLQDYHRKTANISMDEEVPTGGRERRRSHGTAKAGVALTPPPAWAWELSRDCLAHFPGRWQHSIRASIQASRWPCLFSQ